MDWLLSESSPLDNRQMWLIYGFAALSLLYIVLRPMLKRKDPLAENPSGPRLSQQRALERQMEELIVELSNMSRQMTAQLDTRAAKLQALLADADRKIAALEQASGDVPTRLPRDAESPIVESPVRARDDVDDEPDPRHQEIYALADQGRGSHEIATQLNRPDNEVQLILALRRRQAS